MSSSAGSGSGSIATRMTGTDKFPVGASASCFTGRFSCCCALWLYVQAGSRGHDIEGRFAAQLMEDLTSLGPSDHAGDPFTRLKTAEPPSLSLVPAPPNETTISQPEIPNVSRFTPDLSGPDTPEPSETPQNSKALNATVAHRLAGGLRTGAGHRRYAHAFGRYDRSVFRSRRSGAPPNWSSEGGTVHSEKAVEMALDWSAHHQRADGGWALNYHSQCQGDGCPPGVSLESETAATGLALLPMLGAGHIHTKKTHYQPNVRQGLAWLMAHQATDGDLYYGNGGPAHFYSHAIGTMALCEAYGLSHDAQLRESTRKRPSISSPARKIRTTAAGGIFPANRATPPSLAGRCSHSAAHGCPA